MCNGGMERKTIDDFEPGPLPSPRQLDRFGFLKQEHNSSSDALTKNRSTHVNERYAFIDGSIISSMFCFSLPKIKLIMHCGYPIISGRKGEFENGGR